MRRLHMQISVYMVSGHIYLVGYVRQRARPTLTSSACGMSMNKTEFWSIMALGVAILASTNIQLLSLSARISDNTRAIADNAVAIERVAPPIHKELSHIRVEIAKLENRLIREVLNQRNELNDIARRLAALEGRDPN